MSLGVMLSSTWGSLSLRGSPSSAFKLATQVWRQHWTQWAGLAEGCQGGCGHQAWTNWAAFAGEGQGAP